MTPLDVGSAFFHEAPSGSAPPNLGSPYKGMRKNAFVGFERPREIVHTHHPVDDARGNAEALLRMKDMGLKIDLT